MKKVLFFAVVMMACWGLQSCMMDNSEPMLNVKEDSQTKVIFLKSSSCSRSFAAERYFRNSLQEKELKNLVMFVELDEGAEGFDRGKAAEYLKSAKYYYNLGSDITTPVICFGENYISGWDYRDEAKVDALLQPYLERAKKINW